MVHAAGEFPKVFSDHSVLQRECPVPVWGTAYLRQVFYLDVGNKLVEPAGSISPAVMPANFASPAPATPA